MLTNTSVTDTDQGRILPQTRMYAMEDTKGVLTYFVRLAEWLSHSVEHSVCEASLQDEAVLALYELQSTDGNREREGGGGRGGEED